jgi:hypothetical protein
VSSAAVSMIRRFAQAWNRTNASNESVSTIAQPSSAITDSGMSKFA